MGGQVIQQPPLGVGQTWQTMGAARAFATTYYNTTGRAIVVQIRFSFAVSSANLSVDGAVRSQGGSGTTGNAGGTFLTAVVPPGSSYVANGSGITSITWDELR